MKNHEKYMSMAIELARGGTGFVNPNPLVGAVIVKNDRVIGCGYHRRYGELHAERNAFSSCTESAEGADMYVTLEPCCHYGKTPPCTEAIIENKIRRVFIGSSDPNPEVAGKGVKILQEHGIEVTEGVMKDECDSLNDIFFHYISCRTPYVILKYAMTADGKIATYAGKSKWITSEASRLEVQRTRKRTAAIMAGIGTVLADDPMLTCRLDDPGVHTRIICDSSLRIPTDCNILKTAADIPTVIATVSDDTEKIKHIEKSGAKVIKTSASEDGRVDLKELMRYLAAELHIDSILLEGGSELAYSALKSGIVNKLQVYVAPKIFGGAGAKTPVGGAGAALPDEAFMLAKPKIKTIGDDILIEYEIEGADSFCSQE
ncbi:MAG: bifunctional diaminohydroxyphosphoribosylaminopyrimidine deaminase/5-amino-6-(5-phosphoribosylamino)uracil reductase RibD [Ruminococcus sp.]|nr:bifunctional diaminohydroxyphosphoribosylaminopyrimidine deaminase/5-amino-6-(5-phosphoribosylamino)uracil reductase RibD [Ruminococcus sp.]